MPNLDVSAIRNQFPSLSRRVGDSPACFFDGPAGSQVPQSVIDAVAEYYTTMNANGGGAFATSRENDAMLGRARAAVAALLGADDPTNIVFGPNMTTLAFQLARGLGKEWSAGDEIVVTRIDHDANVWPWVRAAEDAGATVRYIPLDPASGTLDLATLDDIVTERTKLVAIGAASNALGTINPVRTVADHAHAVGAEVFVDAVHYAPHARIDVGALGCDYLACSAYKFFGPHVGILWGRRDRLDGLDSYQVRPAADSVPGRWMTGTQNLEGINGTLAAVEYLASLGDQSPDAPLATRLDSAFATIAAYERTLSAKLVADLQAVEGVTVWGVTDPEHFDQRVPTIAITHERHTPQAIAERLGERGIFVWSGHFYALEVTAALDLDPHGVVRIGALHYNTPAEIDRLVDALRALDA